MDISISVVSHHQIALVAKLLEDLQQHCAEPRVEVIITLNMEEVLPFDVNRFSYPIHFVRNVCPAGYGANHNQAFTRATGQYFCVMNPDIRLTGNPYTVLLAAMEDSLVGVAAPQVLSEDGREEDSARYFPSPLKILRKAFAGSLKPDYAIGRSPITPDWVAGMFMVFPRSVFARLGGFDERYFLYYEDVDICARLKLSGYKTLLCPQVQVIHRAHRSSHRHLKYLWWHLRSMVRFFSSPVYWRVR